MPDGLATFTAEFAESKTHEPDFDKPASVETNTVKSDEGLSMSHLMGTLTAEPSEEEAEIISYAIPLYTHQPPKQGRAG